MRERQPFITIASGGMGVGKTHLTVEFLHAYIKMHPHRPVLILDANDEKAFRDFKDIHFDIGEVQRARKHELKNPGENIITQSEINIRNLSKGIRRIRPYTIQGKDMTMKQMRLTFVTICENFVNGLPLFDDVNTYIKNFESDSVTKLMKNIRHKGQDVFFHMQSINAMRPIHYESTNILRMHYEGIDVVNVKDKCGPANFEIMKLAQLIVDEEYLREDNPNIYYCCYVWLHAKKLKRVTEDQFRKAAAKFLRKNRNNNDTYDELLFQETRKNKRIKPLFQDYEKADFQWIEKKLKFYLHR